jgi:hypothetical protein
MTSSDSSSNSSDSEKSSGSEACTCDLHLSFTRETVDVSPFDEIDPVIVTTVHVTNAGTCDMTFTVELLDPPESGASFFEGPYDLPPGGTTDVVITGFVGSSTLLIHTDICGDYSLYLGTTVSPYGLLSVEFVWDTDPTPDVETPGYGLAEDVPGGKIIIYDFTGYIAGATTGPVTFPHTHILSQVIPDGGEFGTCTVIVRYDPDGPERPSIPGDPFSDIIGDDFGPSIVATYTTDTEALILSVWANIRVHADDTVTVEFGTET